MKNVNMNDLEKVTGGKISVEGSPILLQPTLEQQVEEAAPDLAATAVDMVCPHQVFTALKLAYDVFFG